MSADDKLRALVEALARKPDPVVEMLRLAKLATELLAVVEDARTLRDWAWTRGDGPSDEARDLDDALAALDAKAAEVLR